MSAPAVSPVKWNGCFRIIPSRFPPVGLFDRVANPDDLDLNLELESRTNPRIAAEIGNLRLIPQEDRISGPGTTPVMAAFAHPNPEGSRFSDGVLGVFYAANDLATAIEETKFHRERFMDESGQEPMELDMRVYLVDLAGELHDIRGLRKKYAHVYDPDPENYAHGQALANTLRSDGSNGIVYDSVRHAGGECTAVFRPRVLSNCRQERHLCFRWNGRAISHVYEKSMLK